MRGVETAGRFLGAVSVAAVGGSFILGSLGAAESWAAESAVFTPAESFRLVFIYALILSWPVVALAMAVFVAAMSYLVPARGPRRRNLALLTGALGGIVVAIPVAALLMDGQVWTALPIGLIYGLASAAAGLIALPKREAGGEIA